MTKIITKLYIFLFFLLSIFFPLFWGDGPPRSPPPSVIATDIEKMGGMPSNVDVNS